MTPATAACGTALLLEGAQALGMPTLDPDNPRLAQAAARRIIQEALS